MSQLFLMPENSSFKTVFIPDSALPPSASSKLRTSMGGSEITLSTTEAQKLQLGQGFASVKQITDSCWAIRNTLFHPVTPKPDWYDELNTKFLLTKRYADQWIDNIAIGITSVIPSSVIQFTPVFTSSVQAIQAVTKHSPGQLSPSDRSIICDIFTRMITRVESITQDVHYYAKKENNTISGILPQWQKNMSDASLDLKSGSANIQTSARELSDQIAEYNDSIAKLKLDIQYYNKLVATGAGLVGGGAFVGSLGGALCFAFPVVGGIVLALGLGMVIGGAATWGVYQQKINDANKKIREMTKHITDSSQTLLALNSLSSGVDIAINSAENALKNLTDFSASWVTFGDSLKNTLNSLREGEEGESGILVDLDLNTSAKHWKDAKEYAAKLLETPTGVQVVPASYAA